MKLGPYEKDRPCPKCGEKGATTVYLPKTHHPYWTSCQMGRTCRDFVEHLHRWCPNCKYEWCEALAVAPANSEGLTPEQVALDG